MGRRAPGLRLGGAIVGAVVAIVLFAYWVVRAWQGDDAGLGASRAANRIDGWMVAVVFLRCIVAALFAHGVVAIVSEPADLPWRLGVLAVQAALVFPGVVIDRVLVPLGSPRSAWRYSRILVPVRGATDPLAASIIDAARALRRRRGAAPGDARWLASELAYRGRVAHGTCLVAWAELADVTGDVARARSLFLAASRLRGLTRRLGARRRAFRWLMADAAERGAWTEVIALGRRAPMLHEAGLLARLAEALHGRRHHRPALLAIRWLLTPSRGLLRPWLARALRASAGAGGAGGAPAARADASALAHALAMHARVVASPASATWTQLAEAARAWEAVESAGIDADLGRRLARLSARTTPRAARQILFERVRADLSEVVRSQPDPLPPAFVLPPLLDAACEDARELLSGELDAAFEDFESLASARPLHESPDAWVRWSAFSSAYERVARLSTRPQQRLLFLHRWASVCNLAVWLQNVASDVALAREMYSWLLRESIALEAPVDAPLLRRNIRSCG